MKERRRLFGANGNEGPLDQRLYQYITQRVTEGKLTSGDRLGEADLQKVFGVSRTPIREGLRILTSRGLLETIPDKGTFLRKVSFEDMKEIYPVMAYAEGLAANLATDFIGEKTLGEMQTCLKNMESFYHEGDKRGYIEHHYRFHDLYIRSCNNKHLVQLATDLRQ